jgi:hypothetical protein
MATNKLKLRLVSLVDYLDNGGIIDDPQLGKVKMLESGRLATEREKVSFSKGKRGPSEMVWLGLPELGLEYLKEFCENADESTVVQITSSNVLMREHRRRGVRGESVQMLPVL